MHFNDRRQLNTLGAAGHLHVKDTTVSKVTKIAPCHLWSPLCNFQACALERSPSFSKMSENLSTATPDDLTTDAARNDSAAAEDELVRKNSLYIDTTNIIVYILIGFFGLGGNSFAIFILARSRSMRKKLVNVYLINQSAIDLVASVCLIFFGYHRPDSVIQTFADTTADLYCKVVASRYPLWSVLLSSTWNLVLVNFERYVSVAFPVFHKTSVTKCHIISSIVIAWLSGPIIKFIVLVLSSGYEDGACKTARLWPSKTYAVLGSATNITLQFFVPLVLMAVCYILMMNILRSKASVGIGNESSVTNTSQSKGKNILKTLAVVTLVFVLCWTLNNFYFVLFLVGYVKSLGGPLYHVSVYLVFLNSCLNPVIYSAQYKEFQQQMRKVFCFRNQQIDPASTGHSDVTRSTA